MARLPIDLLFFTERHDRNVGYNPSTVGNICLDVISGSKPMTRLRRSQDAVTLFAPGVRVHGWLDRLFEPEA